MHGERLSNSASSDIPVDRWLVWAIRVALAILGVALLVLGFYYFREITTPAPSSLLDRDIRAAESEIRAHPGNPQLRADVASLYAEQGRYDDAIAQAELVLMVNPHHVGALLALGQAHAGKGQMVEATGYLERAVELSKDNPMARSSLQMAMAHQYLGTLYFAQGQMEEAAEQFRGALEIDRGNADTLHLLGKVLSAQQQYDQAIRYYLQALRYVPEFPEVYRDLVRAYEAKGDRAGAMYAGGMLYFSLGDYEQAVNNLNQAAAVLPEMSEVHLGLAMAFERTDRTNEAMYEYRQVLALDSASVAAGQGLARLVEKP